jgi:gluconate 2-dehydrogenase gamma chain
MRKSTSTQSTRRDFLSTAGAALGGSWLAATLPALTAISACAREAADNGEPFSVLTSSEARTMSAFAAQILPSSAQLPGATEAGAVYFVDRAIGSIFAPMRDSIQQGLADLDTRAARHGAREFADLTSDQQIAAMKEVENTPFFFQARMLTIMGVLADPRYGGNRNEALNRLMRVEHGSSWQPPFGYYDAQLVAEQARAGA